MRKISINNIKSKNFENITIKFSPTQIITLGFILLILTGTMLLSIPISSRTRQYTNFTDSLFTATSAVCVTGLVTFDTYTHWSTFGQFIIIFLIQIGGLGIMSLATLFSLLLRRKITLKEKLAMVESINEYSLNDIVNILIKILIATFIFEAIGAFFLSLTFIPMFGIKSGIAKSIFHSISAFCNAGFDIIGNNNGLTAFTGNAVIIFTITSLVILGGLGFIVWKDVINCKKPKKLSLHSKVVLIGTTFLIISGTILILIFEFNNPVTLGTLPFNQKLMNSYFHSVIPRTAGFNTLPVNKLSDPSKFLTIILMFIGAAPGSTAGGIKITTISIILFTIFTVIKGEEEVNILNRKVPTYVIKKALSVAIIGLLIVITTTMALLIVEKKPLIDVLFEATSAFGTVGLSTGITATLHPISKYILIITMYLGRVGPISVAIAIMLKHGNSKINIRYPEGKIIVG